MIRNDELLSIAKPIKFLCVLNCFFLMAINAIKTKIKENEIKLKPIKANSEADSKDIFWINNFGYSMNWLLGKLKL